jgi:hypothetical protein
MALGKSLTENVKLPRLRRRVDRQQQHQHSNHLPADRCAEHRELTRECRARPAQRILRLVCIRKSPAAAGLSSLATSTLPASMVTPTAVEKEEKFHIKGNLERAARLYRMRAIHASPFNIAQTCVPASNNVLATVRSASPAILQTWGVYQEKRAPSDRCLVPPAGSRASVASMQNRNPS